MTKKIVLSLVAPLVVSMCSGWGFLMHRTITQLAIYELPTEMQPFFFTYKLSLVKKCTDPDNRRRKDKTEAPKHFMNLERYGDLNTIPIKWNDATKKISEDTLFKYGYVPYAVVHTKEKLTQAFKNLDKKTILRYAADLAHYVADANVPLHTTVNYDGQLSQQRGIHALWESIVPKKALREYNLYSTHTAVYLEEPESKIFSAMLHAHAQLNNVFATEKEISSFFVGSTKYVEQHRKGRTIKKYTTAFVDIYSKRIQTMINEQLIASASLVADFWYTAWVDAGHPNLHDLLNDSFDTQVQHQIETDVKSFQKNRMIADHLLLAMQPKWFKKDKFNN